MTPLLNSWKRHTKQRVPFSHCHYLIARTIITDPEAYGSKFALVGGGDEELKKNSSVGNLRKIFLQFSGKKKSAKKNIAKMLQELKD